MYVQFLADKEKVGATVNLTAHIGLDPIALALFS